MSIKIDAEKCIGCSSCVEVCPGNLIKLREKKAFIKQVEDCWGCTSCVKACPIQAISFFLGSDIGGAGSTLTVKKDGAISFWRIEKLDGSVQEIKVDSSQSNKY